MSRTARRGKRQTGLALTIIMCLKMGYAELRKRSQSVLGIRYAVGRTESKAWENMLRVSFYYDSIGKNSEINCAAAYDGDGEADAER